MLPFRLRHPAARPGTLRRRGATLSLKDVLKLWLEEEAVCRPSAEPPTNRCAPLLASLPVSKQPEPLLTELSLCPSNHPARRRKALLYEIRPFRSKGVSWICRGKAADRATHRTELKLEPATLLAPVVRPRLSEKTSLAKRLATTILRKPGDCSIHQAAPRHSYRSPRYSTRLATMQGRLSVGSMIWRLRMI